MILKHLQKYSTTAIIEFVLDDQYSIVWASAQACCLLNVSEDKIVSKSLTSFFNTAELTCFVDSLAATMGQREYGAVVHFSSNDKHTFLVGKSFVDESKRRCAIITISELAKSNAIFEEVSRLRKAASTDMLTNLLNKVSFKSEVDEFLNTKGTDGNHCLILVDIDDFKKINDTYGHPFGDTILFECARAMSTLFRKSDLIGRVGGDEFMILMKNVSPKIVKKKANALCNLMSSYSCEKESFKLSISIGIAIYNDINYNFDMLYSAADIALYESKRKGKDCATTYTNKILSKSLD